MHVLPQEALSVTQSNLFPAGSCDCHAHIFGPQSRYPYTAQRRYTPDDALLQEFRAMHAIHGIDRAVLSQPSVYGTDNTAMLDALSEAGPAFRGIAMAAESITDAELSHLGGIRRMAERIRSLGWHVEIHVDVGEMQDVEALFSDYPVSVVIEHMGHMPTSRGIEAPGFKSLLRFISGGIGWVKLSGPYINSVLQPPYADVRPFVEALVAAAPSKAVWGTNWPHPHRDPIPDDRLLCNLVRDWFSTAELRQQILVDNPARLYGFEQIR
jgi:predicted TIM-barrel fold metal-dependent hydrolase